MHLTRTLTPTPTLAPLGGVYTRPHSDVSGPSSYNPTPTPSGTTTPQRRGSIGSASSQSIRGAAPYGDPLVSLRWGPRP